jgi:hypothetical protein
MKGQRYSYIRCGRSGVWILVAFCVFVFLLLLSVLWMELPFRYYIRVPYDHEQRSVLARQLSQDLDMWLATPL